MGLDVFPIALVPPEKHRCGDEQRGECPGEHTDQQGEGDVIHLPRGCDDQSDSGKESRATGDNRARKREVQRAVDDVTQRTARIERAGRELGGAAPLGFFSKTSNGFHRCLLVLAGGPSRSVHCT